MNTGVELVCIHGR